MLMIYGKGPGMKKFRPYGSNALVSNLMYAEFFPDYMKPVLEKTVVHMNADNPGYEFEVRPYGGTW